MPLLIPLMAPLIRYAELVEAIDALAIAKRPGVKAFKKLFAKIDADADGQISVDDVRRQVIGTSLDLGRTPRAVGGLRGGRATVTSGGTQKLKSVQYVPKVKVSGTVRSNGAATLTVRGGGASSGSVKVNAKGNIITGRLGGKKFRQTFAASASVHDTSLPDVADVLRHWKLRHAG